MFNLLFVGGHVFVDANGNVRHLAKYAPDYGLVTPAALKETQRKNEGGQSQVPVLGEVGFAIVYDDRHWGVVSLGTESGHGSLE